MSFEGVSTKNTTVSTSSNIDNAIQSFKYKTTLLLHKDHTGVMPWPHHRYG